MKHTKLLVLTAFTALTLAGCGNANSPASLPAGGKDVDVKTEEGKATMKSRLEGMVDNYQSFELNALGLNLEAKDIQFNANGKLESSLGNFEGKLGLENLGANLEIALGGVDNYLGGRVSLGQTTGKFSLDGKVQQSGAEDKNDVRQSIDLTGAKLDAYLIKDKLYLNGGDESMFALMDRVSGFANGIVTDLDLNLVEISALVKMLGYDLSAIFSKDLKSFDFRNAYNEYFNGGKGYINVGMSLPYMMVPTLVQGALASLKQADAETGLSPIDNFVTGYAELNEKIAGLQFKTYGEKGFGFQFDITRDGLAEMITTLAKDSDEEAKQSAAQAVEELKKRVNKLDLGMSLYVNEKGLIDTLATFVNVEANVKMEGEELKDTPLTAVDFVLTAKESTKLSFKYNDDVQLNIPAEETFADYKEIVLPTNQPTDGGETE